MAATSTPVSESLFRLGLNEALPISDEATTSRVVVNNDVLRTVIFTFDAGQQLTEHASPKAVVVTLLEGEMGFSIEERKERLRPVTSSTWSPTTATTACRVQLVMVDVDNDAVGASQN